MGENTKKKSIWFLSGIQTFPLIAAGIVSVASIQNSHCSSQLILRQEPPKLRIEQGYSREGLFLSTTKESCSQRGIVVDVSGGTIMLYFKSGDSPHFFTFT